MLKTIFFILLVGFAALHAPGARAAGLCAAHPNDDTLRPVPASLAPDVQKLFGLHGIDTARIQEMSVMRCMGGRPYACFVGANLPCGKANMAVELPAAKEWCGKNPDADFIPAYISGHDSAYNWCCRGGKAVIVPPSASLDIRGFFTQYWKPLN